MPNYSKILLVDDEQPLLELGKEFLELTSEFKVDTACSAIEGLEMIKHNDYAAIISDYQMPEMDGIQFLNLVRKEDSIPFILFTGKGREEVAIEAINSGADFYIKKGGEPRSQFKELTNAIKQSVARRQAEQRHIEALERYRSLYDHILALVYTVDLNGYVMDANPTILKALGYERAELIGMNISNIIAPEQIDRAFAKIREVTMTGIQDRLEEYQLRRKDGGHIEIETSRAVLYRDGRPYAIQGMGRDITEKNQVRKSLEESEKRFRQVAENAREWIWEIDETGLLTYSSPVVQEIMGYRPDELVGKVRFFELMLPEIKDRMMSEVFNAFQSKSPIQNLVNKALTKDGRTVILETNGVPMEDGSGRLIGYRGANADITGRESAISDLRRSETRYRSLYESLMDAYARLDMNGRIVESNTTYQVMTGYTQEELSELTYIDITPEKWHEMESRIVNEQALVKGYTDVYRKEYRRKDGTVFPIELRTFLIRDQAGKPTGMWGIVRDITVQMQVEKELRQERDRAQKYLDLAGFMFLALDNEGKITILNKKGCQILGCAVPPVGRSWFDFIPQGVLADTKEAFRLLRLVESDEVEYHENYVLTENGEERLIAWHNTKLRDESGNVSGTLSSGEDITDRKKPVQ